MGRADTDLLRDRLESELDAIRSYRSGGGKVLGSLCFAFPPAIGAGLGMWPVRVLCGATQEMESGGERFVRPDVCPLVKSTLGGVSSRSGLHGMVDAWVGMYTCDQTRRLFQEMSRLTGAVVHHIQLPATRTPEAEGFYVSQMSRLVADIAASCEGSEYDPGKAEAWERGRRAAAGVLARLAGARSVPPVTLHLMYQMLHIARPEGLADLFADAASRVTGWDPAFSIAVAGGPLPLEDDFVPAFLEQNGIAMIPLGCSGLQNTLPATEGCSGDPGCLAGAYFEAMRCTRCRPNERTFEHLEDGITSTASRGLIVKTLKFCDLWFAERERLRARMPVPVMMLDTNFTAGEAERLRTRVEAFMESLS